MKKRTVIKNVPTKFPVTQTILIAFLLHYFDVSAIWWGVFTAIYSLLFLVVFAIVRDEVKIDLDDDKPSVEKFHITRRLIDILANSTKKEK